MIPKRWSILEGEQGTYMIQCKDTGKVLAFNIKNLGSIEKILGWSNLTPESQIFLLDQREIK